ncbi:hypothetical protein HQ545_02520 [Candidatus Woesearchaeota archaeon]|nr:hypothetical protein [Candidatus Woesearchaeota archaeon]
MKISSDVNCIFAYADPQHIFHRPVISYIVKKQRDTFVLLSKLKSNFMYTYKDYLATSCIIIEKAIRDERTIRDASPSKTYKPSILSISANINSKIEKYLLEESEKCLNFNMSGTRKFINIILTEFSIPKLYEDNEVLAKFREKYVVEAEKQAEEVVNRFIKRFNNFECVNIEDYSMYDKWTTRIKKSKHNVFQNKQDVEDISIASEFLAFNSEKSKLAFFTSDVNCHKSILKIAKEYSLKTGHLHLITKS